MWNYVLPRFSRKRLWIFVLLRIIYRERTNGDRVCSVCFAVRTVVWKIVGPRYFKQTRKTFSKLFAWCPKRTNNSSSHFFVERRRSWYYNFFFLVFFTFEYTYVNTRNRDRKRVRTKLFEKACYQKDVTVYIFLRNGCNCSLYCRFAL